MAHAARSCRGGQQQVERVEPRPGADLRAPDCRAPAQHDPGGLRDDEEQHRQPKDAALGPGQQRELDQHAEPPAGPGPGGYRLGVGPQIAGGDRGDGRPEPGGRHAQDGQSSHPPSFTPGEGFCGPTAVAIDPVNDHHRHEGQSDGPGQGQSDQDRHQPAVTTVAQEQQGRAEQQQGQALGVGDLHRRGRHVRADQEHGGRGGEPSTGLAQQAEHHSDGCRAQQEAQQRCDNHETQSADPHEGAGEERVGGAEPPLVLQDVACGVPGDRGRVPMGGDAEIPLAVPVRGHTLVAGMRARRNGDVIPLDDARQRDLVAGRDHDEQGIDQTGGRVDGQREPDRVWGSSPPQPARHVRRR